MTTRSASDAAGPRAHVLGVISGFERLGWDVTPYIVGDQMPDIVARDGEAMLGRGKAWQLAADVTRLGLRHHHARRAWSTLRGVDWVYERFALFQALGSPFVRRGIPWILETNALLTEEASKERSGVVLTGVARRLEQRAYRDCTLLVAISEALAHRLESEMGVPRSKIAVVPNGVDVERFDPTTVSPRRFDDKFSVLFVGSLAPWQGLDTLLRAVQACTGLRLRVLIAGDGPDRAALGLLASKLGIADVVQFLGRVAPDGVPPLIAGADVCYSGHSAFRSPLKLYEYMAMGRPVISSAVPDAMRVLVEGVSGFLFPPGDINGLARALRAAYASRDRLSRMGAHGRNEVVHRHSWEARVRAICARVDATVGARS